jgi:hypothetical protein
MVPTHRPARVRHALIMAIGVALLCVALLVDRANFPDRHEILLVIGVTIISVSVVEGIFQLAGGNPVENRIGDLFGKLSQEVEHLAATVDVIENARRLGIKEMHDRTGNYGLKAKWLEVIRMPRNSMDLMGRTLHNWTIAQEVEQIILDKIVAEGVTFRWLVMSRDNKYLPQLEEADQNIGESVKAKIDVTVRVLQDIRGKLPPDKQDKLKIRTFSHVPSYCSILRVDDIFLVTPYLQSAASRDSPLFIFEGPSSPWAATYSREFQGLWDSASPVP